MKTISSEKELLSFLNMIAKKSVRDASMQLFEDDSYVRDFTEKLEKELDELQEQEGDEEEVPDEAEPAAAAEEEEVDVDVSVEPAAEEEEPPEEEPAAEAEPAEETEPAEEEPVSDKPKKPKVNPAAEKALSLAGYEMGQKVDFDQVLTAINLVRAGNSTKSKKTKEEIESYFNRLDDEEKSVLAIYLKELAKIMTGAIEGENAQDPSDPSTYFDIIIKRDSSARSTDSAEPDESQQEPQAQPAEVEKQDAGEEDVTPPIRVNERQSYRGLKKIRG